MTRSRALLSISTIFPSIRKKKALFIPVTNGGDPDAAYKITRYLQDKYEAFSVLISGMCKSAGTLMAIGADEIVFTPFGELGPLDIQITKVDRFDAMESGLSIQDALNTLEDRAQNTFYKITQDYMRANNGLLSFATASSAASEFVTKLYAPVFGRIDPEEVGSRFRSMRIASEYGQRLSVKSLNLKPDTLKKLAETYPSHSFVIDQLEAETLFNHVRPANEEERALVTVLGPLARFQLPEPTDFMFRALSVPPQPPEGVQRAQNLRPGSTSQNGASPEGANEAPNPPSKQRRRRSQQPVSKRAGARDNGASTSSGR